MAIYIYIYGIIGYIHLFIVITAYIQGGPIKVRTSGITYYARRCSHFYWSTQYI